MLLEIVIHDAYVSVVVFVVVQLVIYFAFWIKFKSETELRLAHHETRILKLENDISPLTQGITELRVEVKHLKEENHDAFKVIERQNEEIKDLLRKA